MAQWRSWPALGVRLREARLQAGRSQRQIGQATGTAQSQYCFYEQGYIRPTRARLAKLAAVLQIDLTELLILAGYERRPDPAVDRSR